MFEYGMGHGNSFGRVDGPVTLYCFTTTHGVEWNPYFFTGIGVGVDYGEVLKSDKNLRFLSIPLYFRFRLNLLNRERRFVPYIETDFGAVYQSFLKERFFPNFNYAVGGKVIIRKFFIKSITFSIGGNTRRQSYTWALGPPSWGTTTSTFWKNNFMFKIGFEI